METTNYQMIMSCKVYHLRRATFGPPKLPAYRGYVLAIIGPPIAANRRRHATLL